MRRIRSALLGSICLLLAASTASVVAQTPDADWPCPQALAPEISAAVVWAGPPVDGLDWRADPAVAALVERLSDSRTTEAAAEQAVSDFAAQQGKGERDAKLTLVFAGVLESLNADRSHLIDGIERYSRDQSSRAEAIGKEIDELVRLEQDTSEAAAAKAGELRKRMSLEERAFDQRERSIQFLCQRPVVVEQRLGVLARIIAAHMDG